MVHPEVRREGNPYRQNEPKNDDGLACRQNLKTYRVSSRAKLSPLDTNVATRGNRQVKACEAHVGQIGTCPKHCCFNSFRALLARSHQQPAQRARRPLHTLRLARAGSTSIAGIPMRNRKPRRRETSNGEGREGPPSAISPSAKIHAGIQAPEDDVDDALEIGVAGECRPSRPDPPQTPGGERGCTYRYENSPGPNFSHTFRSREATPRRRPMKTGP